MKMLKTIGKIILMSIVGFTVGVVIGCAIAVVGVAMYEAGLLLPVFCCVLSAIWGYTCCWIGFYLEGRTGKTDCDNCIYLQNGRIR